MTLETLSVSIKDYIATVTINRPPVNAQNNKLREEMRYCQTKRP